MEKVELFSGLMVVLHSPCRCVVSTAKSVYKSQVYTSTTPCLLHLFNSVT